MAFTIISKNNEKTFTHKELVNICSKDGFDFKLDVPFDCMLTVQYDSKTNRCVLLNQFGNDKFLFKDNVYVNGNLEDKAKSLKDYISQGYYCLSYH